MVKDNVAVPVPSGLVALMVTLVVAAAVGVLSTLPAEFSRLVETDVPEAHDEPAVKQAGAV